MTKSAHGVHHCQSGVEGDGDGGRHDLEFVVSLSHPSALEITVAYTLLDVSSAEAENDD